MKYRKKPITIEAIRWDGSNYSEIEDFLGYFPWEDEEENSIEISTLEGYMAARVGDYIIKGIKGEIYPCKPDIFKATYEAATEYYPDEGGDYDRKIIPTADVVEVVRCRDCKWWMDKECINVNGAHTTVFNPNWFCCSGQRKEANNG